MGAFFTQLLQDYLSVVLAMIIPTLLSALFATAFWKQRAGWLKTVIEALAPGAVARVESDYVIPTKAESGLPKLTLRQQETARHLANGEIQDGLRDLGVQMVGAAIPLVGAAIEKAVQNAKKTLPKPTQDLFPTQTPTTKGTPT